MEGMFANLITQEMVALAVGVIAMMLFIGKIPVKKSTLNTTKAWKNWGIFALLLLCIAGAFAPGVNDIPATEWGSKLTFALVTSMTALLGRAALKPIILERLEGKTAAKQSTATDEDATP